MNNTTDANRERLKRFSDGDKTAADELIRENLGLVKSIAIRFLGRGQELDDLIEIGTLGMLKAIRGFDDSYNTAFSTYAVPMITGEIRRFLRDDGMIKVGREIKKNGYILMRKKEEFTAKYNREPKISELSELSGLTNDEIVTALEACSPTVSLQDKVGSDEDGAEVGDFCESSFSMSDITEKLALREVLKKLPDFDRKLIYLRYYKGLTQMESAKLLGVTQVKVSRTEKKILSRLRQEFA